MICETTATSVEATAYGGIYGCDNAAYTQMIVDAVEHGLTLTHLQRKPIGCPVDAEAYDYAMKFDQLATEQKFRIQQAVKYGHSLINQNAGGGRYSPQEPKTLLIAK